MEEEKSIFAQNLTSLRKAKKLTQLELAEIFNYSDKSLSKWENGDTIPDLDTLISLSDYFGVTLDDLCRNKITTEQIEQNEETEKKKTKKFTRNKIIITTLSVLLVWFVALFLFVQIKLILDFSYWMSFIWALPISFIVLTVFCCIWGNKKSRFWMISFLVWTVLLSLHLNFVWLGLGGFWLLYFLGVPAQISIGLWFQLDFHKTKK